MKSLLSRLWLNLQGHWPGWLGGLLLALAAGVHHGLTAPWQVQAAEQLSARQAAAAGSSLRSRSEAARTPQSAPGDELPLEALGPQRAATLMALARQHGLAVALIQEQTDSSGQLQLALQGKARYPALRSLVGGALTTDPALVLERLSLRRAEPATAELDFELLWTFSHRKPVPTSELADPQRGAR